MYPTKWETVVPGSPTLILFCIEFTVCIRVCSERSSQEGKCASGCTKQRLFTHVLSCVVIMFCLIPVSDRDPQVVSTVIYVLPATLVTTD